jgi:hypothetical protein
MKYFSIIISRTYNGFIYEAYINRRACRRANTTKRNLHDTAMILLKELHDKNDSLIDKYFPTNGK